jgi:hypothetical protein
MEQNHVGLKASRCLGYLVGAGGKVDIDALAAQQDAEVHDHIEVVSDHQNIQPPHDSS